MPTIAGAGPTAFAFKVIPPAAFAAGDIETTVNADALSASAANIAVLLFFICPSFLQI